jgi:hypothetical protein
MGLLHSQSLEAGRERSRRSRIQDLAVDLGGPSLRERNTGSQWLLIAVAGAALMFWFWLRL